MKNIKKRMSIILSLAIFGGVAPLQFEAGVHAVDGEYVKMLFDAVERGDKYSVKRILDRGTNPNVLNEHGDTPLFCATSHIKADEIVKLLLDAGADPNFTSPDPGGPYPLFMATVSARYGPNVVKLLLDAGADPNEGGIGYSPSLSLAAEHGDTEIMQLLIEKGADPHALDRHHETTLHCAARRGRTETVKFLLAEGVDPNVLNERGKTALYYAAENGNPEIVRLLLLQAGADPNAAKPLGPDPSPYNSRSWNRKTVKLLLAAGTDVDDDATRENIEELGLATYT